MKLSRTAQVTLFIVGFWLGIFGSIAYRVYTFR
jgi:hypothetical protein